ncbi:MAG: putative enzyme related to lactoylglutathione lyase [Paracoccaceae bacterium]|jgi:predicted enzyme related to lactoylglutathione lyase
MGSSGKKRTSKKAPEVSARRARSPISWFEIPVHDLVRAKAFYSLLLSIKMQVTQSGDHAMAYFPNEDGGVGGALVAGPGSVPSGTGPLIYLNAGEDLTGALAQVEGAGGRVILGKSSLGDAGNFALFIDTEGNKLALHSRS